MKHFFTADLHFGHDNIIKYCNRPFSKASEMNGVLIDNWNSRVDSKDQVWILGDIAFLNQEQIVDILKQLKGNIHVILGNHDRHINGPVLNFLASEPTLYKELSFAESRVDGGKQNIVLFHYPMLSWNRSYYKSWHLHGHIHSTPEKRKRAGRYALDVGVDGNNFFPYSYENVFELMMSSEVKEDDTVMN
jgi:calcineurin-like phosphoesterase family protein